MARYDDWSKEDLAYKCRRLEDEVEELRAKLREAELDLDSERVRIHNELEPRLKAERRAYDNYITDPSRGRG